MATVVWDGLQTLEFCKAVHVGFMQNPLNTNPIGSLRHVGKNLQNQKQGSCLHGRRGRT